MLATLAFVTAWLPLLAAFTGRYRLAALCMVLPVAVCAPVTNAWVVPALEGYITSRPVALAIERQVPPRAALVLFDEPPPSLRFLARRHLVQAAWYASPVAAPRAADGYVYLAFRPAREQQVTSRVAAGHGRIEVLARTPGLVLARAHS
jgi:hypothetical protein